MKITGRDFRPWIRVTVAIYVAALLALAPVRGALAQESPAAEPASCLAHEASAISPPGTSDEVPGGMPGLKAEISAAFPAVPLGLVYSFIAELHAGSHEACDAALEG